ncbi:MAG: hypothetical protein R3A13_05220 [Bdellovibrionota bacterium]
MLLSLEILFFFTERWNLKDLEAHRIANSPEDIPLTSMHLELTSQILNFIRSYEKPKPSAEELKANQEWQDFRYRHRSRRRNKR